MLSRRAFLAGTAAVAGAGAVGVAVVGPSTVLHRVGLRGSPDHRVPNAGGPIAEHQLDSTAMARTVTWAIATPPEGARGVIVCLHGRHSDHRAAFDSIHLHDVAADLHYPLAIVSVDGGPDSYWHPRSDGSNALAMVLDELLPSIDRALGAELPRAVLGWSMGGYGALLAAEQAPARFMAVAAASPALWRTAGESSPGAFDGPADFNRFNVFTGSDRLNGLAVRIDCGTSDGFIHTARLFAAQLPEGNLGSFTAGYHDAPYWRSIAPAQLTTIARTFGL